MAKPNQGRWFALAAGVGFGVWFGAVLAVGREDQARTIDEDQHAACSVRNISDSDEAKGMPSASQVQQGCR